MFENMEKQLVADLFVNAISQEDKDHKRLGGIYVLKRFEAADWFPDALQMAINELPAGSFEFDEVRGIESSIADMTEVLQRYIDIVEEKTGAPAIQNEFFSARAAAWYIARKLNQQGVTITPRGVDLHLRGTDELRSSLTVGKAMLFTRQQLDEYVANYVKNFDKLPKRGRPSQEPVTN